MSSYQVFGVEVQGYQRCSLHGNDSPWLESNCYLDLWIEIVHCLGYPPEPLLACTLATDYQVDQWTFTKPLFTDLWKLYGFEVDELILWRSVAEHCESQINSGNLMLLEVDAYFLPDALTDYRKAHTKTAIAINMIDRQGKQIGYFHGAGYYQLSGDDYDGLLGVHEGAPTSYLPPYCEIIRTGRRAKVECVSPETAKKIALFHLARRPTTNPFLRYAEDFDLHLRQIEDGGMDYFHVYAFSYLRQCGASFEFASKLLYWLGDNLDPLWHESAHEFGTISSVCKSLLMKLSRVAVGRKTPDFADQFDKMAVAWQRAYEKTETLNVNF